jgi:hypothetical protein
LQSLSSPHLPNDADHVASIAQPAKVDGQPEHREARGHEAVVVLRSRRWVGVSGGDRLASEANMYADCFAVQQEGLL